jgi:hypothetical protein
MSGFRLVMKFPMSHLMKSNGLVSSDQCYVAIVNETAICCKVLLLSQPGCRGQQGKGHLRGRPMSLGEPELRM